MKTKFCLSMQLLVATVGVLTIPVHATDYYVNRNASPTGSGSSWSDAFQSIGEATTSATFGDNIFIAGGEIPSPLIYVEAITVASGVSVYGGFPPTGDPTFNERNPGRYLTIVSADVNGDDTANFGHRSDNYAILISVPQNASADTLISGLVIRGATQHAIDHGATSRAQFTQLVITDNGDVDPGFDGAGFNNGGSLAKPTIRDCLFQGNQGRNGGALNNPSGSLFLIDDCDFVENIAYGGDGGAINSASRAITVAQEKPLIRRSRFVGNRAKVRSFLGGYGGAIRLNGKIWALSSEFRDNSAEAEGGALYFTFSNMFLAALLFDGNVCEGNGGAISGFRGCKLVAINCLFHDNEAGSDGGAIYALDMSASISSTIP